MRTHTYKHTHTNTHAHICTFTGSSLMSRGLGMRRQAAKASLHDPFEEGALVLYTPRELSAHEQLTIGK